MTLDDKIEKFYLSGLRGQVEKNRRTKKFYGEAVLASEVDASGFYTKDKLTATKKAQELGMKNEGSVIMQKDGDRYFIGTNQKQINEMINALKGSEPSDKAKMGFDLDRVEKSTKPESMTKIYESFSSTKKCHFIEAADNSSAIGGNDFDGDEDQSVGALPKDDDDNDDKDDKKKAKGKKDKKDGDEDKDPVDEADDAMEEIDIDDMTNEGRLELIDAIIDSVQNSSDDDAFNEFMSKLDEKIQSFQYEGTEPEDKADDKTPAKKDDKADAPAKDDENTDTQTPPPAPADDDQNAAPAKK